MNILFIGSVPPPVTGQSLACKVLLDELVKLHNVDVVNLSKDSFKQGINSLNRVVEIMLIFVKVFFKKQRADIIYFTISESVAGNIKDLIIYLLCYRHLSKMVIHLHGGSGFINIINSNNWLSYLNKLLIKRVGGAIVLGERHINNFSSCLPEDRIHIVPNFAEDYLFVTKDEITAKFADITPIRLLFLSNLLPGKGHNELLEAYCALEPEKRRLFTIDFAGGFESDKDKQSFLDRISNYEQIRYHGVVHGAVKKKLFARAHVFCLPTYYPYEGQPISILEAYASGCAVITTDHSGILDIFTNNVNGYEVTKQSVCDLTSIFCNIIKNSIPLREMAINNHEYASKCYRVSIYCSNLMNILNKHVNSNS